MRPFLLPRPGRVSSGIPFCASCRFVPVTLPAPGFLTLPTLPITGREPDQFGLRWAGPVRGLTGPALVAVALLDDCQT